MIHARTEVVMFLRPLELIAMPTRRIALVVLNKRIDLIRAHTACSYNPRISIH